MRNRRMVMKTRRTFCLIFLLLSASLFVQAQSTPQVIVLKPVVNQVKSSPAFAELILRRTERESELEEFLIDYTEEFPKVKELKFELILLQNALDKISAVNASESGKLTSALGKLMVRKVEIGVDLWNLKRQYNDDHPEVKRARRKVEVFEKAIREILP